MAVVSLYLASQSLQVFITIWEAFHKDSLETDYMEIYSYLNDVISIMTLLCRCVCLLSSMLISPSILSAIRFPVYMSCNRPIFIASIDTLHHFDHMLCDSRRKKQLKAIHSLQQRYVSVPTDTVVLSISKTPNTSHDLYEIRASLEDSEEQWMV